MYNSRVFNEVRGFIQDEEVLEEIHRTFQPYDQRSLNRFAPPSAGALSFPEQMANLPTEQETLEAIVFIYGRPALFIQDDEFEEPVSEVWQKRLAPYRANVRQAIQSTGRIEVQHHPRSSWIGTGWMIRKDMVITNRHVAEEFAQSHNDTFSFRRNFNGRQLKASMDFKEEYQRDDEQTVAIKEVIWIAPEGEADIAFLKTSEVDTGFIEVQQDIDDGAIVAVIGYPAFDTRNGLADMNRIFKRTYNVKRFQPGKKMYDGSDEVFHHDCSTLGGNSGSPVIDITTGKAVGLHFAGRYLDANAAVKGTVINAMLNQNMVNYI